MKRLSVLTVLLSSVLVSASFIGNANAAMTWTDAGDPYGAGLRVLLVYPDLPGKSLIFKCADEKFYRWFWDQTQTEMTSNAKSIFALLLTAMTSEKSVSLYYNNAESVYITVQQLNVHN